jgi:4-hydroxy-3-polyprenylbenzoate decarboxylase
MVEGTTSILVSKQARPAVPRHGYTLGDWTDEWEKFARRTAQGDWEANGIDTQKRARPGLKPETPVKSVEKKDGKN